jgi:hypothetical protein
MFVRLMKRARYAGKVGPKRGAFWGFAGLLEYQARQAKVREFLNKSFNLFGLFGGSGLRGSNPCPRLGNAAILPRSS